jgi:hypothetical protein
MTGVAFLFSTNCALESLKPIIAIQSLDRPQIGFEICQLKPSYLS